MDLLSRRIQDSIFTFGQCIIVFNDAWVFLHTYEWHRRTLP